MTTNTPEPEIVKRVMRRKGKSLNEVRNPNITARECIELADYIAALQAERELAEREGKLREETADKLVAVLRRAEQAEAELAALEVKTWNAAIEAAAEGFELDDGHYYDQVRESILRLKK